MKANKAISKIMKEKKVTQQSMATAIGKKRATDISARLASDNMGTKNVVEMLEVLGYELVIQPKSKGQRREGSIVIDLEEEEDIL